VNAKLKQKPKGKAARWSDACIRCRIALERTEGTLADLEEVLGELREIQGEYEEWKDNLPENLHASALGEKLEEVCNLEIDGIFEEIDGSIQSAVSKIDEAEGVDLPQGFGRD
jgi:hypothetical protein